MTGGELGRSWKSFGGDRGECVAKGTPRATKPGRTTLCGQLEQALRSDAYVGFREGQLTLVNHSRS